VSLDSMACHWAEEEEEELFVPRHGGEMLRRRDSWEGGELEEEVATLSASVGESVTAADAAGLISKGVGTSALRVASTRSYSVRQEWKAERRFSVQLSLEPTLAGKVVELVVLPEGSGGVVPLSACEGAKCSVTMMAPPTDAPSDVVALRTGVDWAEVVWALTSAKGEASVAPITGWEVEWYRSKDSRLIGKAEIKTSFPGVASTGVEGGVPTAVGHLLRGEATPPKWALPWTQGSSTASWVRSLCSPLPSWSAGASLAASSSGFPQFAPVHGMCGPERETILSALVCSRVHHTVMCGVAHIARLATGQTYTARVRVVSKVGTGPWTETRRSFSTIGSALLASSDPTVMAPSLSGGSLRWVPRTQDLADVSTEGWRRPSSALQATVDVRIPKATRPRNIPGEGLLREWFTGRDLESVVAPESSMEALGCACRRVMRVLYGREMWGVDARFVVSGMYRAMRPLVPAVSAPAAPASTIEDWPALRAVGDLDVPPLVGVRVVMHSHSGEDDAISLSLPVAVVEVPPFRCGDEGTPQHEFPVDMMMPWACAQGLNAIPEHSRQLVVRALALLSTVELSASLVNDATDAVLRGLQLHERGVPLELSGYGEMETGPSSAVLTVGDVVTALEATAAGAAAPSTPKQPSRNIEQVAAASTPGNPFAATPAVVDTPTKPSVPAPGNPFAATPAVVDTAAKPSVPPVREELSFQEPARPQPIRVGSSSLGGQEETPIAFSEPALSPAHIPSVICLSCSEPIAHHGSFCSHCGVVVVPDKWSIQSWKTLRAMRAAGIPTAEEQRTVRLVREALRRDPTQLPEHVVPRVCAECGAASLPLFRACVHCGSKF
jgi:hypothetical protein